MPIAIPRSSLLAVHSDRSTSEILSDQENTSSTEPETSDPGSRTSFSRTTFDRNALRERSTHHIPRIPRLRRPYLSTYPFDVQVEELHAYSNSSQTTAVEPVLALAEFNGSHEKLLDFIAIFTDGGEYSPYYSLSNIQVNDDAVYCSSNRTGSMNIKLMYCIWMQDAVIAERSCVISRIIIKVPRQNIDGPCRFGLIFFTHEPIAIENTTKYDHFTKEDYEAHVAEMERTGGVDDICPVAWFEISSNHQCVVNIKDRSGRYLLIKLLREEDECRYMDLQYVGVVGYVGPRAFFSVPLLQ
ncbi:hypothetical protein CLU79DRAFT_272937 [Phycomyces nitens]|nr:hypothetical protein CLU79DRAFT_272937 [Phycomyces nitens]